MKREVARQTPVCLTSLEIGVRGRVVSISGDPSTQNRLRELGVGERCELRVLHVNGSVLCQVNDSRFGIDRRIAEGVLVEPLN